ncbi:hypothetical protein PYCCODRAFT_1435714 [Trametes coccinea BRFM310]|uniref:Uncharacterized protein n=1 Tax=Trametes coccinea (strain BRFM310) TaxID=1353009 RepID=A0A1Y2IP67_TRAC3|nr:hypothetical protein PYCCODRAFT_1435714 [Trametes coccinea BRFM310]
MSRAHTSPVRPFYRARHVLIGGSPFFFPASSSGQGKLRGPRARATPSCLLDSIAHQARWYYLLRWDWLIEPKCPPEYYVKSTSGQCNYL